MKEKKAPAKLSQAKYKKAPIKSSLEKFTLFGKKNFSCKNGWDLGAINVPGLQGSQRFYCYSGDF